MTKDSPSRAWRPLHSGGDAERALEAVEQIARELRSMASSGAPLGNPPFSLVHGQAGLALFFAYLYLGLGRKDDEDLATEILGQAIDGIGEADAVPSLYMGFPGVAWMVEHLHGRLLDPREDPGKDIAEALSEQLRCSPWPGGFDLLNGLVGLGVYGLERLPRASSRDCVESVVSRLAETAERSAEGLAWRTKPEWLPAKAREEFPDGYYSMGIAHGLPGVIGFLGEVYAAGVMPAETLSLIQGAVDWLLSHKLPPGSRSIFPYSFHPRSEPNPTRLSWCYGDLGIAVILLSTARRTGRQEWEREARALARTAAARAVEAAEVKDACLCHGTAGIAHLFLRIFQATEDPAFAEAARFWIQQTLSARHPGQGIAGFPSWSVDGRDELGWQDDPGFLNGAAGVGLALLAAAVPVEPAWDRVLLLSVP